MRFRVRLIREKGHRLPWREIENATVRIGGLGTHTVTQKGQAVHKAELREPNNPLSKAAVNDLRAADMEPCDAGGGHSRLRAH